MLMHINSPPPRSARSEATRGSGKAADLCVVVWRVVSLLPLLQPRRTHKSISLAYAHGDSRPTTKSIAPCASPAHDYLPKPTRSAARNTAASTIGRTSGQSACSSASSTRSRKSSRPPTRRSSSSSPTRYMALTGITAIAPAPAAAIAFTMTMRTWWSRSPRRIA